MVLLQGPKQVLVFLAVVRWWRWWWMLDYGVICWVQSERVFALRGGVPPRKSTACVRVGSRRTMVSYTLVPEKENTRRTTRNFAVKRRHVSNGVVSFSGSFCAADHCCCMQWRRHLAICKCFVWHRGLCCQRRREQARYSSVFRALYSVRCLRRVLIGHGIIDGCWLVSYM